MATKNPEITVEGIKIELFPVNRLFLHYGTAEYDEKKVIQIYYNALKQYKKEKYAVEDESRNYIINKIVMQHILIVD